jgi:quercetin dioxygenase-like cupin family protein
MQLRSWMSATALVLASGVAVAQMQVIAAMPDQVNWGPAPGLPPDWQVAVLMGDPAKAGPYVERVKLPPNAVIPPHTHPDNENITVLSGSFGIGEGEAADKAKGRVLSAGSFYYLPANMAHFAWAGPEGAVVQIHGIGPSGIKMISK